MPQHAERWAAAFDRAGVQTGFFIAVGEGNEELAEFVRLNPARFQGWGSVVDPTAPDAAAIVRRFPDWGLRGPNGSARATGRSTRCMRRRPRAGWRSSFTSVLR